MGRDRPFRILVVEDFPDARELYCDFFSFHGFEVHDAEDGVAGLERARSVRPDVVLLDLGLPRLDGMSVLTAMRDDPTMAALPVVIVTAHAEPALRARAASLGVSGFLTKPCLPDDVMRAVRTSLDLPATA